MRFGSKVDIGAQSFGIDPLFLLALLLLSSFSVALLFCTNIGQPIKPVL